jgi:hypothetical protein
MSTIARAAALLMWSAVAMILGSAGAYAQATRVNPTAKAIAQFQQNVQGYVQLHKKLESTLPKLSTEATPEEIDQHQRALERLVQQARRGAKAGDIFSRDVRVVIRRLLAAIFRGPDGPRLRHSIMDENPGPAVKLVVNGRYPDTIPLSTVPPQVLKELPPLPDDLEYRFISNQLILLDRHAHIIVDYVAGAVPR